MPKRDTEHMQAQRERILRAALTCMGALGIEHTSVSAIRREAGLSAGALYTHFSSKEEIIAAALRFGGGADNALPDEWADLAAYAADLRGVAEFDPTTIARTQLQILASSIRPGPLHDMFKPVIEEALAGVASQLEDMERDGRVKLRLPPMLTALAISALKDGLVWFALARDRPLSEVEADLAAALDCLIENDA